MNGPHIGETRLARITYLGATNFYSIVFYLGDCLREALTANAVGYNCRPELTQIIPVAMRG
jgi:hypothetical protein